MIKFGYPLVLVLLVCSEGFTQINPDTAAQTQTDWSVVHRRLDQQWPNRGLTPRQVRSLRIAAGISDGYPGDPIQSIDARSFQAETVFLVTRNGNNKCVKVSMFSRQRRDQFKELWSAMQSPRGVEFCSPQECSTPSAWAMRSDGKKLEGERKADALVVSIPRKASDADPACDLRLNVEYRIRHGRFTPLEEKTTSARCAIEDSARAFDSAVNKAAGPGETVVSVEVLPSFQPRWAVVVQRLASELHAYSLVFPEGLFGTRSIWDKDGLTPSQCLAMAGSAPVKRTEIVASQKDLQPFIDQLQGIDLRSDRCPRQQNGDCALLLDGQSYIIRAGNSGPVRLADLPKGLISENPALYQWVKQFLHEFAAKPPNKP